ncbi:MAG TPA: DivIVA domain-containing protein [Mycobacteriales bacterium]|nr:DivIVA domain-containing protein [Mycobacteriales bacterium]
MPLTPEDVANKRFTTVRFKEGYDEAEVDRFLDEVEAELRRLLAGNAEVSSPPPAAPEPPAETANRMSSDDASDAALRTLMLAQRTADEAVAEAHAQAAQIVAEAESQAATLRQQAQRDHDSKAADLERQRAGLVRKVDELREFERTYRERLAAYLKEQLADLDRATTVAPPAPAGLAAATPPPAPADRPPHQPPAAAPPPAAPPGPPPA